MISLFAKLFIKDKENTSSPEVRKAYGVLCGSMGIALNILLFAGKFLAGKATFQACSEILLGGKAEGVF